MHQQGQEWGAGGPLPSDPMLATGKISVKDEELDAMLKEASGPLNFTMFLNMFGEKLTGEPSGGAPACCLTRSTGVPRKSPDSQASWEAPGPTSVAPHLPSAPHSLSAQRPRIVPWGALRLRTQGGGGPGGSGTPLLTASVGRYGH